MSAADVAGALAIGFAAGVASGLLGIGGGVLFVPGLALILGLSQVEAEATSLLAIIPVSLVGAWRQQRYGNVKLRDGLLIGALSPLGVVAGVVLAHALPERALELMFAAVLLYFAFTLARVALRGQG
ncbi:MAG: TSUP family transporter [Thermoleophilaceae bacterium]